MKFSKTLSSILRGRWLIDQAWAETQLPLVLSLIKGGESILVQGGGVERSGNGEFEQPFFIDPKTMERQQMYIWVSGQGYVENPLLGDNIVGIVPINGAIMKNNGDCGEPGSIARSSVLMRMDKMSKVRGVVLLIDSPGGMVDGTATLANTIKSMSKHTIGFVDDGMACSAAMWIGSACDELYASKKTDTVGSIGVYTTLVDFTGYFEAQGIKVSQIYAPQSTEKNLEYKEALAGNEEPIKEDLKIIAAEFIQAIKTNRPGAAAYAEQWSKGGSFYASDAVKIGLLDGIMNLETVVKRAAYKGKQKIANTSTMSYTKILETTGSESIALIAAGDVAADGGFLLSEEQMNTIEASLAATDENIAGMNAQVIAANSEVGRLTLALKGNEDGGAIASLQEQLTVATSQRDEAVAVADTLQTRITEMEEQMAAFNNAASGTGTHIATEADENENPATVAGMPGWYKDDGSMAKLNGKR